MGNIEIYRKLAATPQSALKTIQFGALKGKFDINPQWRYEIMTEVFGLCGQGWYFEISKTWTQPLADGQLMVFAEVKVYIKDGDNWSAPIVGIGGNMLIELAKGQLKGNDEGYKMAVTDALGTALKMIGVAADVYAGKMDGSKYEHQSQVAQQSQQYRPAPASQSAPAQPKPQPTEEQIVHGIEDCIHNGDRSRAIKGLNVLKATYPNCVAIESLERQLA